MSKYGVKLYQKINEKKLKFQMYPRKIFGGKVGPVLITNIYIWSNHHHIKIKGPQ